MGTDITDIGSTASEIENAAENGTSIIEQWIRQLGGDALDFQVRLVIALILFFIFYKFLKKFSRFMEKRLKLSNADPAVIGFLVNVVYWGALLLMLVTLAVQLGIASASSIAALIASAGVGISLAAQGTLSNLAGGVLILMLKPFRLGDYIRVPAIDAEGTVVRIDMYYTTMETAYHEQVKIPNSSLTNNQVRNYTALGRRKLEILTGISYTADLQKAKKVLEGILDAEERMEKEERVIYVDSLGDSQVVLGLRGFVAAENYLAVKWSLNEKIKMGFDREGIQIPYPQVDVHLKPAE